MSHVVSIKTELRDLDAVEAACKELGLTLKRGQKSIKWYGRWVNDYDAADAAYKLGIKTEDYGKSDHAITVPGSGYEVGLLRNPATGGYKLYFDFYGHNGQAIQKAIGQNGEKLVQLYATHKATSDLRKKGMIVQRQVGANGSIKLVVTELQTIGAA